ncbi:MAG: conjugal transfer protein TrbC, partial [Pseudorhizobium sp.]
MTGVAGSVILTTVAPAVASSGGSLPWEGPLEQIQESITGPV